jgi:hypothetical protein
MMKRVEKLVAVVSAVAVIMVFLTAGDGFLSVCSAGVKGSALSADGGEPGKDYMTYVKAVEKRDGATIRKMAEVPPGTSDKDLKEQMEMVAAMTPTGQKIVSGSMSGNKATLNVTGMLEGKKQYGTIDLQKRGGVWKITKEDWKLSPGK